MCFHEDMDKERYPATVTESLSDAVCSAKLTRTHLFIRHLLKEQKSTIDHATVKSDEAFSYFQQMVYCNTRQWKTNIKVCHQYRIYLLHINPGTGVSYAISHMVSSLTCQCHLLVKISIKAFELGEINRQIIHNIYFLVDVCWKFFQKEITEMFVLIWQLPITFYAQK